MDKERAGAEANGGRQVSQPPEGPADQPANSATPDKSRTQKIGERWQITKTSWRALEFDRKIELWLAGAITVATIVNVCIATRQWNAAAQNNKIAQQALNVGQRAFVHLDKIEFGLTDKWSAPSECNGRICAFNIPRKIGQVERTTFHFTNAGNTPTKTLKINIQCPPLSASDRHPADPFDLFSRTAGNIIERSMGAKQTIPVTPETCEYKDDDTIMNAAMRIVRRFLLGEVTYEDWVEPGKPHVTRFAHELIVNNPGDRTASPANTALTGVVLTTEPVGRNNCTDEDCH
jgi:hypothetical protein